jgi:AraC-like DNA-binding protein
MLMQLDGSDQDVDRFARLMQDGGGGIELLSPFERRMSWDILGLSGSLSSTNLRSGIALSAARLRWEQSSSMVVHHSPAQLEFVLSRGPGPRVRTDEGANYLLGSGVFHVGQVKRPVRLECDFSERSDGDFQEHICLNIDGTRLNELLGTQALPASIERVVSSAAAYPRSEQPMGPELFRLLDEIVYCDARGISRQIYLEAKGLELLAVMVDRLEEVEHAASPLLSPHDVERLERARRILLGRIEEPPSLPELARSAGLNEVKLKAGFKTLFGSSVYAYLRHHRMEEAHRMLRQRLYTVTEVAQRVGYANPSKFAEAFRKQFGVNPSDVS